VKSEKANPTNLRLSLIRPYSTSERFGPAKRQPETAIQTAIEAATISGKRIEELGDWGIATLENPLSGGGVEEAA
jgi:hypothetical protein